MRILLVDDDPLILRALNRTIQSQAPSWEVLSVESGEEAIGWLTRTPFDLVMTDMQMPGMDGSAVLRMARNLQPAAIRLVLSGHAPMLRILEAEGYYHRFLLKPINPNQLMAILVELDSEHFESCPERARTLVTALDRIPSLPQHMVQLLTLLEGPDPSLAEVSETVSQDLGMVTSILRLVNSAFLSSGRPMTDLHQAIEFLGKKTILDLMLSRENQMIAMDSTPEGLNLEALYAHSKRVGTLAKTLVLAATGDSDAAAEAYAAGLLHDVGMVAFATEASLSYGSILNREPGGEGIIERERELLGMDHARVGGQLLALWGFPKSLVTPILEHHGSRSQDHSSLVSLAIYAAEDIPPDLPSENLFIEGSFLHALDAEELPSTFGNWTRILADW